MAVGACAGMYAVCKATDRAGVSIAHYAAMMAAVLFIYTADHFSDAAKLTPEQLQEERRIFFKRNRPALKYLLALCSFTLIATLFFLPAETLYFGIATGAASVVYLISAGLAQNKKQEKTILTRPKIYKEPVIALLYSLVICGIVHPETLLELPGCLIFICYAGIAMQNLLIISMFEMEQDKKSGFLNLVSAIGTGHAVHLIYGLGVVVILTGAAGFLISVSFVARFFALVIIAMSMWLCGIMLGRRSRLIHTGAYRGLAESVFLFPVLLVFA